MFTMLGDKVQFTSDKDVTLFIDMTGQDWTIIRECSPASTYIITSKAIIDVYEYIDLGFVNICPSMQAEELTRNLIRAFLDTEYEDNLTAVGFIVIEYLMKEYKTPFGLTMQLVDSIMNEDYPTFKKIVSYSMPVIKDSMNAIMNAYLMSQRVQESAIKISDYKKKIEQLSRAQISDNLSEKYQQALLDNASLRTEIERLMHEHNNQIQSVVTQQERETQLFADKELKVRQAELTITELKQTVTEQLALIQEQQKKLDALTDVESDAKDKIIVMLKEQLAAMQASDFATIIRGKLPIYSKDTAMDAKQILYFKEVKPAIYINSVLVYLNTYVTKMFKDSSLIVVFDPLISDATKFKYQKRGWGINHIGDKRVVVTNSTSLHFLNEVLGINRIANLIVFDRFGLNENVIETKLNQMYFLINTPADISDFKLDPNRCVGFFEQNPGEVCKYNISPATVEDRRLIDFPSEQRSYRTFVDKVFPSIMEGCGMQ